MAYETIVKTFDANALARYWPLDDAFVLEVARAQCKKSLEAALEGEKSAPSVLELRDWMCSELSRGKDANTDGNNGTANSNTNSNSAKPSAPPSAAEIRAFMDHLRSTPPEARMTAAIDRVAPILAPRLSLQADVVAAFVLKEVAKLPRAKSLQLSTAVGVLMRVLGTMNKPLKVDDVQELCVELRLDLAPAQRLLLDVVGDPTAWHKLYEDSSRRAETWGGVCLPQGADCNSANSAKTQTLVQTLVQTPAQTQARQTQAGYKSFVAVMPLHESLFLMRKDGSTLYAAGPKGGQTYSAASAACAKLSARVIAAATVPLTTFAAALLADGARWRGIVLWDILDPGSFAVLHEYEKESTDDVIDVQLNSEGDILVQACTRGANGRAASRHLTMCVRVVGKDVSTVHHTSMDAALAERLLAKRLENWSINHMDHGNVLSWATLPDSTTFWYGGHVVGELGAEVMACWGNPFELFAWTNKSPKTVAGYKSTGLWVGIRAEGSLQFHSIAAQHEGIEWSDVVAAVRIHE